MSFGFSIGDFIAVSALAWSIYDSCKTSTKELQQIGTEIASLQFLLEYTAENIARYYMEFVDIWKANHLKMGCQEVLEELQRLLRKYDNGHKRDWRISQKVR
jgi:hypothetical protein